MLQEGLIWRGHLSVGENVGIAMQCNITLIAKFLNQSLTKTTKGSCRAEGIESKTIVTRRVVMKSGRNGLN